MSHSVRRGIQLNHIQAGIPSAKFEPKSQIWLISILSHQGGNKLRDRRVYQQIFGQSVPFNFRLNRGLLRVTFEAAKVSQFLSSAAGARGLTPFCPGWRSVLIIRDLGGN